MLMRSWLVQSTKSFTRHEIRELSMLSTLSITRADLLSHVVPSSTTTTTTTTTMRRSLLHTSLPRLQQQQALNRSNNAIRDHLLLLLTPTNQDSIDLQSVLYDLKEISDPDLTMRIFNQHIIGKEEKLTQRDFTLAINCLEKVNKSKVAMDLHHAVAKKNPAALGELPLIALLRALRNSESGAREGLAIYKEALNDATHYPHLAYNSIAANSAIGLCYNLKTTSQNNNASGIDEALSIKEMLDQKHVAPHLSSYGLLISMAAQFQRYVVAKTLYREYLEMSQKSQQSSSSNIATASIFVETAMISAALKAKDFPKCYEIVQKMSKLSKATQNPYATCHMLVVFMQTKEWRIGMEVMERYLKEGALLDAVLARVMKQFIQSYLQDKHSFTADNTSGGETNVDKVLAKEELDSLYKRAETIQNTLFNRVIANLEHYDPKEMETIKLLVEYADVIATRGLMGRVVQHLLVNGRPTTRLANFFRAASGKLCDQQLYEENLSLLERSYSYASDLSSQVHASVLGHVLAQSFTSHKSEEEVEYLLNAYIPLSNHLKEEKTLKALILPIIKYNAQPNVDFIVQRLRDKHHIPITDEQVQSWLQQRLALKSTFNNTDGDLPALGTQIGAL